MSEREGKEKEEKEMEGKRAVLLLKAFRHLWLYKHPPSSPVYPGV
jgi:hypothetical protein